MQSGWNAAAILDALGDPVRRVIFQRISRLPSDATTLARTLPVTRSAVARHLGVLRRAGLVSTRSEGARQIYARVANAFQPLRSWIDDHDAEPTDFP